MSYQKKYYYTFKDLNTINNTVELWQNVTGTTTPIEVYGAAESFSIELAGIDNKFQTIRGTGCDCNIVCKNNMEFLTGLYISDLQNIIIKHYYNGNINWIGYLNSEQQRETFSDLNNYVVSFTGNDGFSLMDRLLFTNSDGTAITGIKSQLEILQIIFQKVALPFVELKIALTTTFSGQTGSTILSETYVDTANFINEDSKPETLRKVLDGILAPYGSFITQQKGNIIITDINNLFNSSYTYQKYTMTASTYTYIGTEAVTGNIIEMSSIGYRGTGSEIEISGGKNKQTVSYSPYPIKEIQKTSVIATSEFYFVGLWSYAVGRNYRTLTQNMYWNGLAEGTLSAVDPVLTYATYSALIAAHPYGADGTTYVTTADNYHWRWNGSTYVTVDSTIKYGSVENIHMILQGLTTNTLSISFKGTPYLILPKSDSLGTGSNFKVIAGSALLIKGKIRQNYWLMINSILLTMKIKIGDYCYDGLKWTTTDSFFYPRISRKDDAEFPHYIAPDADAVDNLGNDGNDGIYIPITEDLSGVLVVQFYSNYYINGSTTPLTRSDVCLWLGNLSIDIVQPDGTVIPESDVEYIGMLDSNYANEADKVSLICGTESSISDRGKLLYNNGTVFKPIKSWSRGGTTDIIENLLLNSLSSNFKAGYYTLNSLELSNSFNNINILKNSTYLSDKYFMLSSYKISYENSIINCTITEINNDSNTLI